MSQPVTCDSLVADEGHQSSIASVLSDFLIPALVAFGLSLIGGWGAIRFAVRLGFLDRPGTEAHKRQARAVPYGGGPVVALALVAAVLAGWLAGGDSAPPKEVWYLAGGATVLLGLGLIDDLRPLGAGVKLAVQAAVAAAVVPLAGLEIDSFRGTSPLLAYGAAWAWLVLVTNAYNLIDHADGYSGAIATVSATVLLSGALLAGHPDEARLWLALIAALAGFLVWNLPPARLYLGDAGSLPLGFLIGYGTLSTTFWDSGTGGTQLAVLAPVLITAIPLFDTAVVVVKRWRRGQPLMRGDRNHLGHRLTRLGLSSRTGLACTIALQTALAASALQLRRDDWLAAAVTLGQAAAVLVALVLLETTRDHGPQSNGPQA